MGDVGDGPDGHDGAGRPQDMRDRDEPGVGGDGGVEGGDGPGVVAVVARVDEREVDVVAVADRVERADPARVLVGVVTARPPVRQSGRSVAAFIPSVVEWLSATARTSVPRTAATPARASSIRPVNSTK